MASVSSDTCSEDGCTKPAARGGRCWSCDRARYGGRTTKERAEAQPRPSGWERVHEAALELADAGDDDEGYARAVDNLRKASKAYGRRSFAEAVKAGLVEARRRGARMGRPSRVDPVQAADLARMFGVRGAARMLGVSPMAVMRAKRQV